MVDRAPARWATLPTGAFHAARWSPAAGPASPGGAADTGSPSLRTTQRGSAAGACPPWAQGVSLCAVSPGPGAAWGWPSRVKAVAAGTGRRPQACQGQTKAAAGHGVAGPPRLLGVEQMLWGYWDILGCFCSGGELLCCTFGPLCVPLAPEGQTAHTPSFRGLLLPPTPPDGPVPVRLGAQAEGRGPRRLSREVPPTRPAGSAPHAPGTAPCGGSCSAECPRVTPACCALVQVFDFKLTEQEMNDILSLDRNLRLCAFDT